MLFRSHKVQDCQVAPLCSFCNLTGHNFESCPRITCFKCGLEGHRAKSCQQRKIWVPKRLASSQKEAISLDDSFPSPAPGTPNELTPSSTTLIVQLESPAPSPSSDAPSRALTMTNFPVRPFPFISAHAEIVHGPVDRLQRNMLVVEAHPLSHEEFGIVTVNPPIPDQSKRSMLTRIATRIERDLNYEVV